MHSVAREIICDFPWCAERNVSSAVCRSAGGTMIRCMYFSIPFSDEMLSLYLWYTRISSGTSLTLLGNPSSAILSSCLIAGSDIV